MAHVLRVDAPPKIRRFYNGFVDGGFGWLAVIGAGLLLAGWIAFVIELNGRVWIGVAGCGLWIFWWGFVIAWALTTRHRIARWRVPVRLGLLQVYDAHAEYWKLTPETRTAYGLALVRSVYRLAKIEVEGPTARGRVTDAMHARVSALKALVDAEDRLRLYSVEPSLRDADDIAAAQAFQLAVENAQQQLRHDDILR